MPEELISKEMFTIDHSTRSTEKFVELLKPFSGTRRLFLQMKQIA
jgi:hypothetical protein